MSQLLKKQEEQDLQKIRELLRLPHNKRCFECGAKSPFFVDMTIQTFVCSRCSGLVREVGHRVKSISTSKFSGPETTGLEMGGNAVGRRLWQRGYGNNKDTNDNDNVIESDYDVRLFMRQKYYDQRWLDQALWNEHCEKINKVVTELYNEDGIRRSRLSGTLRLSTKIASPTTTSFALPPLPPPSSSTPTPIRHASSSPSKNGTGVSKNQDLFSLDLDCSTTITSPPPHQQHHLFDNNDSWMSEITSSPMVATTATNPPSSNDPFGIWSKPSPINTTKPNIATTTIRPLAPPPSSPSSPIKQLPPMTSVSLDPFAALRDLSL